MNSLFSTQRSLSSVLTLFLLFFFSASALAAEPVKKSKGIPANPPAKKRLKGIPANERKTADSEELTEEEKALVKKIAEEDKGAAAAPRQKVELPPEVLAARPPVVPVTRAPMPPALPPGDPNEFLRQIPRPPKRIRQPELLKLPPITAPTTDPTKKKKF